MALPRRATGLSASPADGVGVVREGCHHLDASDGAILADGKGLLQRLATLCLEGGDLEGALRYLKESRAILAGAPDTPEVRREALAEIEVYIEGEATVAIASVSGAGAAEAAAAVPQAAVTEPPVAEAAEAAEAEAAEAEAAEAEAPVTQTAETAAAVAAPAVATATLAVASLVARRNRHGHREACGQGERETES
jgi:hypothetical protein